MKVHSEDVGAVEKELLAVIGVDEPEPMGADKPLYFPLHDGSLSNVLNGPKVYGRRLAPVSPPLSRGT